MAQETSDGVLELLDGLYLIAGYSNHSRSIPGYAGASVYLIRGSGNECVLIDTGFKGFTDRIVALLAQLGVASSDVAIAAYTHSHDDHVESYEHYQRSGARIAIHEAARGAQDWRGKIVNADVFFADGAVLETGGTQLRVFHTPGHTPDSCCFLTELAGRKVLFAGDLTGWFFPCRRSDYRQMVESVEKARSLGADLVCGGHWICDHDLSSYWEKLSRSLGEGIFSLVDRFGARDHCEVTTRRLLAEEAPDPPRPAPPGHPNAPHSSARQGQNSAVCRPADPG